MNEEDKKILGKIIDRASITIIKTGKAQVMIPRMMFYLKHIEGSKEVIERIGMNKIKIYKGEETWIVQGKNLHKLMKESQPYIIKKKQYVVVIDDFMKTSQKKGDKLSPGIRNFRENCKKKMDILNGKRMLGLI